VIVGLGLVRPAFPLMLRLSLSTVCPTTADMRLTRLGVGGTSCWFKDCPSVKLSASVDGSSEASCALAIAAWVDRKEIDSLASQDRSACRCRVCVA